LIHFYKRYIFRLNYIDDNDLRLLEYIESHDEQVQ